ncbi:MAG: hypothetical protein HOY76_01700 [Streptomyces sp.]|nr:hypothetical protein [Streptomyces sp.]
MDLGVLDHVIKSVREVTTHTRAAAPNAEPPPAAAADIYQWMIEATPHLDVERKMIRDAMIYRQGLEHALEMNDEDVVGLEPCPSCACWGLFWQSDHQKAMCANRRCNDRLGQPSMWTLQQLARHHVARKYADRKTAT